MSRWCVGARRPGTSNQLSYTTITAADRPYMVAPVITPIAQQILDEWTGQNGWPVGTVIRGYTCVVGIPSGSGEGVVHTLTSIGSSVSPPFTFNQSRPVGIKVQAITRSNYTAAAIGATGAATPDWKTIGHVAEAALTAATGLFAVGGVVVPQLRLASMITGGAQMFVKGVNDICTALTEGKAVSGPNEGSIVTVYHTSDNFTTIDFTNPPAPVANNTLMGIANTINNIQYNDYSGKPTGTALGLLDVMSQAIKLVGAFSDAGGTIKDQLLNLIQDAIDGQNGSAMDALMTTWKTTLDGLTADLRDRANNDPATTGSDDSLVDSVTAISDLFKPGAQNVWTQDLFPDYFKLQSTGANITEVLTNNPWPGTGWPDSNFP